MKISELPEGTTPLTGGDQLAIVQAGQTVRIPTAAIAAVPATPSLLGVSSGWLSGGEITVNLLDAGKFDVAAGTGVITDANDPTTITSTDVTWSAVASLVPLGLLTQATTFVAIDAAGTVVQSLSFPVEDALRDLVQLGGMSHGDNINIGSVSDFVSTPPYQLAPSMTDFMVAIGVINVNGNTFAGSGNANLKFSKSIGTMFYLGINAKAEPNNPNNIGNPALSEPNIIFSWGDGAGSFNTKIADGITAGVYDDGTGGPTDPTGTVTTNNWVNCRFKYSPDLAVVVLEYGGTTYNSSASAALGLKGDVYGDNPSFAGFPIRGYVSLRGAAGNTDIVADAVFTDPDKFGGV